MKLLLHACCGPCSLEPVRLLQEAGHDLTIAYLNSNIHPFEEYVHRRDTILAWAHDLSIPIIEGVYDPQIWENHAGKIAEKPGYLREDRCRACYRLRFEEAASYASSHNFDGICTTLSVSPYQFTDIIREELETAGKEKGLEVIFEDFRPFYPQATQRSRDLGMYRQNYCGCRLSNLEAAAEREERKRARKAAKAAKKLASQDANTATPVPGDSNKPHSAIENNASQDALLKTTTPSGNLISSTLTTASSCGIDSAEDISATQR